MTPSEPQAGQQRWEDTQGRTWLVLNGDYRDQGTVMVGRYAHGELDRTMELPTDLWDAALRADMLPTKGHTPMEQAFLLHIKTANDRADALAEALREIRDMPWWASVTRQKRAADALLTPKAAGGA